MGTLIYIKTVLFLTSTVSLFENEITYLRLISTFLFAFSITFVFRHIQYKRQSTKKVTDLLLLIEEQKNKINESIINGEFRYRSLFETHQDGILILKDGKYIDCNQKILSMFDATYETIIDYPPHRLSPPYQPNGESSETMAARLIERALNNENFSFEWMHRTHSGKEFLAEISFSSFKIIDDKYITVIIRDITKIRDEQRELTSYREKLEELVKAKTEQNIKTNDQLLQVNCELLLANKELINSNVRLLEEIAQHKKTSNEKQNLENILKQFINMSSDGIAIFNSTGQIEEWNTAMEELTGFKKEEVLNKFIWDIDTQLVSHEESSVNYYNFIKTTTKHSFYSQQLKRGICVEGYIRSVKGIKCYIQSSIFQIPTINGFYIGRITRDITQKKRLSEQLEEYKQELEKHLARNVKKLNQLSEKFNEVYNNTSDAILFIDIIDPEQHLKIFEMNNVAKELFMITPSQTEEDLYLEQFLNQNQLTQFFNSVLPALLNGQTVLRNDDYISTNTISYWQSTFIPVKNYERQITGFALYLKNRTDEVTKNKMAAILETAVESWPVDFWVCDKHGQCIMQNKSSKELWGEINTSTDFPMKSILKSFVEENWKNKKMNEYPTLVQEEHRKIQNEEERNYLLIASPVYSACGMYEGYVGINIDITAQKKAEEAIRLEEYRLNVLLNMNSMSNNTINQITDFALSEAIKITKSKIGYLALINEDETMMYMYSWYGVSANNKKPVEYEIKNAGLWAEAVRRRSHVVTNHYASTNKHKKGIPEGHTEIIRHMNIPVFDGEKIVALIGVGNKDNIYNENDIRQLNLLMQGMWKQIMRKKYEEALFESERKYKSLVKHAPDGLFIYDCELNQFIEANRNATQIFGCTLETINRYGLKHFYDLSNPEMQHDTFDIDNISKRALAYENVNFECSLVNFKNEKKSCEVRVVKMPSSTKKRLRISFLDITERKMTEQKIMQTIIDTEEKERKKIAANLHDDIGPQLAGLSMYISTIACQLKGTEYESSLEKAYSISKNSIEGLRAISRNLSPHHLESFGIVSAIKSDIVLCKKLIKVIFRSNLKNKRFDLTIEAAYYRVFKELLNNSIKHAKASQCKIALYLSENKLTLHYSDNGIGFEYQQLRDSGKTGIGLLSIENRVNLLNGSYNIKSEPGKGFTFYMEKKLTNLY